MPRRLKLYTCKIVFKGACHAIKHEDLTRGSLPVGEDGQRTMMIASIRYLDQFAKQDGGWLFAERRLMVNWTETRPFTP